MKQEALNHPNNDLNNVSFQQKSTALSLVITIGAALGTTYDSRKDAQ